MIREGDETRKSRKEEIPSFDERFLWANLRKGNKEAFEVIYRKHVNHLFNFGMHIFMDRALVEDALHDLFIQIWKRRAFLGDTDSIRFYLCKSLKRLIVRKLRTKENEVRHYAVADLAPHACDSIESEMITDQRSAQASETISRALASLPERQREIIVHRFFHNLSAQQISAVMSLSIDSTYTLLSRAVRELRKSMKKIYLLAIVSPFL